MCGAALVRESCLGPVVTIEETPMLQMRIAERRSRSADLALRPDPDLPCHSDDPDLWFAEHPIQINRAKALCAECPIREACLAGALDRAEAAGVWGGELLVKGV